MTKGDPLISVVTCTYNRAHLIGETIQSVLTQTWKNLEYIIVDDGSTDNTSQIVSSFSDPRIKYYSHVRTGGHLSRLRNFAHQQCQGEFIAYIDSDDLWEPDKLTTQIVGLLKAGAGFSFTGIVTFDEAGTIRKSIYGKEQGTYTGKVFQQMLDNQLIICHTTLVVRRSALEKTGPMDESLHSGDHDTVFFLSRYFDAFVVYSPLVRVRKHEGNSTSNPALNLRLLGEHHRTLRKLHDRNLITAGEYRRALALTSYSFGHQLIKVDPASSHRYFLQSWRLHPWDLKSALLTAYTLAKKIFS
jgi:glycosyltransferase involved in cell wall biosynthesis